ncbi:cysteine desulfurase-like protein [Sphingomonas aerophila]|uniref:Cysteine desulfurase family protein (TIGR01976 family) n=1 Tax=Sphingomonas aerophila TaxID=1344948 RepID=A0A7W9BED6_9SPHN|nr:cysteine desulfurase-like protein [Sphingomonas aerophila]MBB5715695.1 cysteine desulfurase family protein (TIGR01976 family) [Sphingomonas aerophila]
MTFPIDAVRARFPALSVTDGGQPRIYFDAPGGTQACVDAIQAMAGHLLGGTANAGGRFATSITTDATTRAAHAAMADLLGGEPDEIAFGPNMTTLTLSLSRALARDWREGDEVVLTRLDHDANVAPWLLAAQDRDVTVRWLPFDADTGRLCLDQLPGLLNDRTRLVAVGGASNALGTLNDLPTIVSLVRQHSPALVFVDAVQSVPHIAVDVRAIGCDFLACSPYKFFGPHAGVLWGRAERWGALSAYKVRPAATWPAAIRLETGTPSFEAQAGTLATIEYLAWLGGELGGGTSRRDRLVAAMEGCVAYERELGDRLLAGLRRLNSVRLYGPDTVDGRVPTFAFTVAGHSPGDVAQHLADRGIFAWSGHFYAVEAVAALGLEETGGLVRVGLCHYNTAAEVDRLLEALAELS